MASSSSLPKPPLRLRLGPSYSAVEASLNASAAFLTSFWNFLSSMTTFVGVLPLVSRAYALRAFSRATRTLSRSSSSWTKRCTYWLPHAPSAAARAFSGLLFAIVVLHLGSFACFSAILYPGFGHRTRALSAPRSGRAPVPRRRRRERRVEHLGHRVDEDEREIAAQVLRDLVDVGLVQRRRDHRRDAIALRRERLLLQAADRQHLAGERHLAGHRHVVAHAAAADERGQRGHHRDPRARAVLRGRAGGDVDVDVVLGEPVGAQPGRELAVVAAHVRQGRLRGLLHHVAELAGDGETALARHRTRLDEQHVAADRRPRQAGGHAGLARAALGLGDEARLAEQLVHALGGDARSRGGAVALRHSPGDLAAHRADLALEVADARLARVLGDHGAQRA